ncbi:MAG: PEP-CTERM sorting domain-containing protein [Marinobacter sp.]|uniref:PEP-CTERM sorting domain-containing protein n=1 Tax=Marinobacter sp. TaxID=50741 RepID=UPI003F9B0278
MRLFIGRFGVNLKVVLMLSAMILASLFTPSTTMATIITVEPDDFAEGTDLSNVSPYVSLQSLGGTGYESQPVYSTRSNPRYRAPTGELVFGTFGSTFGFDCGDGYFECAFGFGMTFHQPVSWVSLLYQNIFDGDTEARYYNHPLDWFAYDSSGEQIAKGRQISGSPGQVFSLNLAIPNMKHLVVGANDGVNLMETDRLSFAVDVPEPTPAALLAIGLGAMLVARKRKLFKVVTLLRSRGLA